jgi:hypothetical protein
VSALRLSERMLSGDEPVSCFSLLAFIIDLISKQQPPNECTYVISQRLGDDSRAFSHAAHTGTQ